MEYLIIWLVFGVAAALIGSNNEGSGGCGWFIIGVLLGPIGLLFALFAKPKKAKDIKTCPACAEEIKEAAKVCKHCGHEFPEPEKDPYTK